MNIAIIKEDPTKLKNDRTKAIARTTSEASLVVKNFLFFHLHSLNLELYLQLSQLKKFPLLSNGSVLRFSPEKVREQRAYQECKITK